MEEMGWDYGNVSIIRGDGTLVETPFKIEDLLYNFGETYEAIQKFAKDLHPTAENKKSE